MRIAAETKVWEDSIWEALDSRIYYDDIWGSKGVDHSRQDIIEIHEIFQYVEEYVLRKEMEADTVLAAYLGFLDRQGILDQGVEMDVAVNQAKTGADVLSYLDHAVMIDPLAAYASLGAAYKSALSKVTSLLPRLSFTNFAFDTVQSPTADQPYTLARISLTVGKQPYVFMNNFSKNSGADSKPVLGPFFFQIFNRVLAEEGADIRLARIYTSDMSFEGLGMYRILLLNRAQYDRLLMAEPFPDRQFRYHDPDWYAIKIQTSDRVFDVLSTHQSQARYDALLDMGLMDHMKELDRVALAKDIKRTFVYNDADLLHKTNNLVFSPQTIEDESRPYMGALQTFLKGSRGTIQAFDSASSYTPSGDSIWVHLKLGEIERDTTFLKRGVKIDSMFVPWLNRFMEETQEGARFYQVRYLNQTLELKPYVYLRKDQYAFIHQKKWFQLQEGEAGEKEGTD